MKRLLSLLTIMVFMTGMVMAQSNSASTTQNGNNNQASQTQSGSDNEATIEQGFGQPSEGANMKVQNDGEAIQEQDGSLNEATIKQRSGSWTSGNYSKQDQDGKRNDATMIFYNANNWSEQVQQGESNTSFGQVSGQGNEVSTSQEGVGNWAKARLLDSENSSATIEQVGEDNRGEVSSTGSDNEAVIKQDGEGHDAYQEQAGQGNKAVSVTGQFFSAEGTETEQIQEGNSNLSRFEMQRGSENYAKSVQNGDNNHVFYRVRGDNNSAVFNQTSYSPGNVASAITKGNENEVVVDQDGTGNMVGYKWGDGIYQEGDYNIAEVTQEGEDNFATIDQLGSSNDAYYQVKGDGNKFWATQEGGPHNMMNFDLYDEHDGDLNSNNYVRATQDGMENDMWVTLKGDNTNEATSGADFEFTQEGDHNQIRGITEEQGFIHTPDNSEAFFYEGDQAEQFTIAQEGELNIVEGDIRHGAYMDLNIQQNGSSNYTQIDSRDWNNTIDVDQMGSGNVGTIYQRGGSNAATIYQNGMNNTANISQQ